jgi:hypothetical protein
MKALDGESGSVKLESDPFARNGRRGDKDMSTPSGSGRTMDWSRRTM